MLLHRLRDSAVTKTLSDKWKARLEYSYLPVCMLIPMGNISRPPKLSSFPKDGKFFFLTVLILKKNFKEPNFRSIVIHILRGLVGFVSFSFVKAHKVSFDGITTCSF